jgi:hypothetical protein
MKFVNILKHININIIQSSNEWYCHPSQSLPAASLEWSGLGPSGTVVEIKQKVVVLYIGAKGRDIVLKS